MSHVNEETLYAVDDLLEAIGWDDAGLVTAVLQDATTREVLMVAYMNRESLSKTLSSGQTWFWSRSRGELWNKGATSGHVQHVRSVRYDCDADALLILVDQVGSACHTNRGTCFYRELDKETGKSSFVVDAASPAEQLETATSQNILSMLEELIAQRDLERPEGAYTTYLFEHGVDKILKKIGEEAGEVIIAAKNRDPQELRYESADLIYHLLVLLREQGMSIADTLDELASRHLKKKSEYPSHAN
jgi:phosphoribosyl-ATP pyrophosphohydrolase/phosphoribosyl-AMP cyclohydrolase